MNIYVANLSFDISDEDLKKFFTPYGEVRSAKVIMDKATGRSRGFGFVEMADDASGKNAITELDGSTVEGRPIKVNEAKPKPDMKFGDRSGGNFNNSKSYNQNRY